MATSTVTLWNKISRGPGVVVTPTATMPNRFPSPIIKITPVMDAVDIADTTLTISWILEIQDPVSSVWSTFASNTWTGGPSGRVPSILYSCSVFPNDKVRASITFSRAVSFGATATFITQ